MFKLKNKKFVYAFIGFIVLLSAAFFANDYMSKQQAPSQETINLTQSIYFVDKESNGIKSEEREVGGENLLEMLYNAVEKMETAPKNESLTSAIPEGLTILGIELGDEIAKVNLSSNYNELKTGDEMLFRAAIVWTFTDFYFVDEVELLVDGTPLTKSNGEELGPMGRDDLIIDAQIEAEPTSSTRVITLFFADETAENLIPEERRIEVNANQPIEKYIMEQLILGPKETGSVATVPHETKIRSIQTMDGICYVDLSQEFASKHNGGSTGEYFTIYSIVNSLCELSEVEKVQFLIEGEKQDEFKGHMEFSQPFAPLELEEEE